MSMTTLDATGTAAGAQAPPENPADDAGSAGAGAAGAEAAGEDSIEPEGLIAWDGELESLQSAEWFKSEALPDDARNAIIEGLRTKVTNYNRKTTDAWTKAAEARKAAETNVAELRATLQKETESMKEQREAFIAAMEGDAAQTHAAEQLRSALEKIAALTEERDAAATKAEAALQGREAFANELREQMNGMVEKWRASLEEKDARLAQQERELAAIEEAREAAAAQEREERAWGRISSWLPHHDKLEDVTRDYLIQEANQLMELSLRRQGVDLSEGVPPDALNRAFKDAETRLKLLYPPPANPNPAPEGAGKADEMALGGRGPASVEKVAQPGESATSRRHTNPFRQYGGGTGLY